MIHPNVTCFNSKGPLDQLLNENIQRCQNASCEKPTHPLSKYLLALRARREVAGGPGVAQAKQGLLAGRQVSHKAVARLRMMLQATP